MNSLTTEKLRVRIFGKDYELDPGGLTPLEANQLATYVDQKMREIADKFGIVDTQKVAVLAALNIAFELSAKREAPPLLSVDDERKIQKMISVLENAV